MLSPFLYLMPIFNNFNLHSVRRHVFIVVIYPVIFKVISCFLSVSHPTCEAE